MSDRRIGERRAPEKGVIKLSLKKVILWVLVIIIILISVITNIVLGILYSNAKKELDFYSGSESEVNTEDEKTYEVYVEADRDQISSDETVNFNINVKINGIFCLSALWSTPPR